MSASVPAASPEFSSIARALEAFARGEAVVVVDDPSRENEGDIILAAELATPEAVAFVIRHTSGIICVAMPEEATERLSLPQMVEENTDTKGTAFTVSVDARDGTTTGIGAAERARTIRLLSDPAARPGDFRRPGHVFPLLARPGGVLERTGHTEAGVDLSRLAGLSGAAALSEVVGHDGEPLRLPDLFRFAREHDLCLVTIADLIRYRTENGDADLTRGGGAPCVTTGPAPVRGPAPTSTAAPLEVH
jgi:3,4-dihydroxy 2-butanone 4-phosphate synthase/GTP cyclohydrolase II